MAKGAKKVVNGESNPESIERKRLKKLAHSNDLLSAVPATDFSPLAPSKTVAKHHGADILKKSQKKIRYLFSFPGLFAPISGGKIGDLTNLGSKNPTLYLDFPQGRMKLFGTIVYPSNRYLTLQFSRSGNDVKCEDYFDTMIVFSDACWVGKKDENPQENRLPFPVELYENSSSDYDFQGGAGATVTENQNCDKVLKKSAEEGCVSTDVEAQSPAREDNMKKSVDMTPVRNSERTAGKRFKFTDISSGEDSPVSGEESSGREEAAEKANTTASFHQHNVILDEVKDTVTVKPLLPQSVLSGSSRKKVSQSGNGRLVQATISTLLNKVSSKATESSGVKRKASSTVKAEKAVAAESRSASKKRKIEIKDEDESDDIEEFSSPSQDSDEDWAA